jgi:DNA-binding LacI/PurR family transcriptional regulator
MARPEENQPEQPPRRRATSADVAREAGVSRATVSYVLNRVPHQTIPESTRQLVLEAAKRLNYTPSAAARTLRRGRSDLVLYTFADWPIGHNVAYNIENVSRELDKHGLTLVARHLERSARPLADLWSKISPVAVIGMEGFGQAEMAAMRAAGIQVVVAMVSDTPHPGVLTMPQRLWSRAQLEHLAATGHRRIGYALPTDPRLDIFAKPRLAGVREACAELGLAEPVVQVVAEDETSASRAVEAWRAGPSPVTAVCAYNDEVAFALLAGIRALGLVAPTDLAVVGMDDIPQAKFAVPPLTTVAVDVPAIAKHLALAVVRGLHGEPFPELPANGFCQLVVRESA